MYEPWFVWSVIGVACIGLEMLLPGFVIFFFGMGALATALASLIPGVSSQLWLQVLIFVISTICSFVFLRRKFLGVFGGTVFDSKRGNIEEGEIGGIGEVTEAVTDSIEGRVRYRGTTWKALCKKGVCVPGSAVRILERRGMTYIIESLDGDAQREDSRK